MTENVESANLQTTNVQNDDNLNDASVGATTEEWHQDKEYIPIASKADLSSENA